MLRRVMFKKGRLAEDPTGEFVKLDGKIDNRTNPLGEIVEIYQQELPFRLKMAKVRFFNGEPWSQDVALASLWIIPQKGN